MKDIVLRASTDRIPITLNWPELHAAAEVGIKRAIANMQWGSVQPSGFDLEKRWQVDIEGAAGELAVAKWAGMPWDGNLGNIKAADVDKLQVRTTPRHTNKLWLYPKDNAEKVFVLATGLAPTFLLRGWIWAYEGQRQEYWSDPTGKGRWAYFVPSTRLHPMADLKWMQW